MKQLGFAQLACVVLALELAASGTASATPLRVGWNSELSGAWTFTGTACYDAAQLALTEVNSQDKRIELILQDNQTNPAQAAAAARLLDAQEKVTLISGPTNSDTSLAIYGFAEENQVPFLVPVAAFPRLTKPGTHETFRMEPDAVGWGYAAVKFFKSRKADATIGIMSSDFAVNRAIVAGLKYQAEKDGLKIVQEIVFPQTATDATVQIAQMKAKRPDFVYVAGASAFDATLTKQLLEFGFKPEQLYHPFGAPKQILAWGETSVGSYYGTFFDHNLPNLTENGHRFVEAFRKAKGYSPGYQENFCYATIHFLNEIADKASVSRDAMRTALRHADHKEITTGVPIKFDSSGARSEYIYVMQLKSVSKSDFGATKADYIEWSAQTLPVYDLAP